MSESSRTSGDLVKITGTGTIQQMREVLTDRELIMKCLRGHTRSYLASA